MNFYNGNLVEETRSGSINSLLISWAGNGHLMESYVGCQAFEKHRNLAWLRTSSSVYFTGKKT